MICQIEEQCYVRSSAANKSYSHTSKAKGKVVMVADMNSSRKPQNNKGGSVNKPRYEKMYSFVGEQVNTFFKTPQ